MAFEGLVNVPYDEVAEYEGVTSVNSIRGVINISGTRNNDTLFDDSNLIVIYEIMDRSQPEVIIERAPKKTHSRFIVKRLVKRLRKQLQGTHIVSLSVDREHYDVVLVDKDLVGNGVGLYT